MLPMRINRRFLLSAVLSAMVALGCGSPYDDGVVSVNEFIDLQEHAIDVLRNGDFPSCGPEMPFSLVLTGTHNGVAIDQTLTATEASNVPLYPENYLILWDDSEVGNFIEFALDTSAVLQEGGYYSAVGGSLLFGSERAEIDAILKGSGIIFGTKLAKLYIVTADSEMRGVVCNNQ